MSACAHTYTYNLHICKRLITCKQNTMRIYTYVFTHIYIYVVTLVDLHYGGLFAWTKSYAYIHKKIYTCNNIYAHTHTHTYIYIYACVCLCV